MSINFLGRILKKYRVDKREEEVTLIEPISKIEPLRSTNEVVVDEKADKTPYVKRINETYVVCTELIRKYEAISDYEYKVQGLGYSRMSELTEFKNRLETFLRLLDSRTSKEGLQDLLDNIDNYFFRIDMSLPSIMEEINSKYNGTVVESGYRFEGDKISKWREEAMQIMPGIPLERYNDYQLKEYVVAHKNGASVDFIISIMDPRRAPEHIRLMLLLPDTEMLEVIQHPEYSVDKIKTLFPDILNEIKNKRGLKDTSTCQVHIK